MNGSIEHPISPLLPGMLTGQPAARSAGMPDYIRAAARAIHAAADPIAYQWHEPNGDRPQISRAQLNQHFVTKLAIAQAEYKGERRAHAGLIKPLLVNDIARSLMGQSLPLGLRSRRTSRYTQVRFDPDAHKGENDILAMKNWVSEKFPNWPIYWSAIGIKSGQGHIRLDRGRRINRKFRVGYRQVNRMLKAFRAAFEADAIVAGFTTAKGKARIEIQGSFLGISKMRRDENGFPTHARVVDEKMGTATKLPRITSAADAKAFKAAVIKIDDPYFVAMVERGEAILNASAAAKKTDRAAAGPSRRVAGLITDPVMNGIKSTDTATSSMFCAIGAIQTADDTTIQNAIDGDDAAFERLLTVAHDLYARYSGSRHHDHRTPNRDKRMAIMMRKALRRFDPLQGTSSESRGSASQHINRLAATFKTRIPASERRGTSPLCIAVIYHSMMTDFAADHFEIPVEWLRSQLRHFHAKQGGTAIGDAVTLLVKYGYIRCTDATYSTPLYRPSFMLDNGMNDGEIYRAVINGREFEECCGRPLTDEDRKCRVTRSERGHCRKYTRGNVTLYYHDDVASAAGGGDDTSAATSSDSIALFSLRNILLGPSVNRTVNPWGGNGAIQWPGQSETATSAINHANMIMTG